MSPGGGVDISGPGFAFRVRCSGLLSQGQIELRFLLWSPTLRAVEAVALPTGSRVVVQL